MTSILSACANTSICANISAEKNNQSAALEMGLHQDPTTFLDEKMERLERFYRIDQLIRERTVVPLESFLEELEISKATFKRDIEYMRDRFNAPIEWDRDAGGYRFGTGGKSGPQYALPGLWFNASEIHALLTMQELLKGLQPGLLSPHVQPLQSRLNALIEQGDQSLREVQKRVRITRSNARPVKLEHFELAASATLKRQRLLVEFFSRGSGEVTTRVLSPQRLVYYRANWYLDAYCHMRKGLRSFAVDGIRAAQLQSEKAADIPDADLNAFFSDAYGIFSGKASEWAVLRFSPRSARWVATEYWHSRQRGRLEPDGSYVLEIPFGDDRELVMDILRHGPDCYVESPPALRKRVADQAEATAAQYAAGKPAKRGLDD